MMAFCLALSFAHGQAKAQSLTIIEQDYEKARLTAQQQHKLLLIDFYTTWCVPCKELDKKVFRDSAVSREVAKDFVVLRYDAEKDSAYRLSLKHHINMYPSAVVLNQEQFLVHRMYGTGGSDKDMVKNYRHFLQEGIDRNARKVVIRGVSNKTDLAYPKFYEAYVFRTNTANVKEHQAAWWNSTSDWLSEVPFAILCYFGGGTDAVNTFFLQNKEKYKTLYGELDVLFVTTMLINDKAFGALRTKNRSQFDSAMQLARQHMDDPATFINVMEERMLQAEGRWPEALTMFEARKKTGKVGDAALAYWCSAANERSDDPTVLQQCLAWMKELSEQRPFYDALDVYARLLWKTGDKEKGRSVMEQAVALGKANQEDVRGSEVWLKKNGNGQE
jgi:thiol-disulfide isomerase/thioredoxin